MSWGLSLIELLERTKDAPYWNAALSIQERVADLLGRMTLLEKARQLDMVMGSELFAQCSLKPSWPMGASSTRPRPPNCSVMPALALSTTTIQDPQLFPIDCSMAAGKLQLGIPCLSMEEALHGLGGAGYTIFHRRLHLRLPGIPAS